MYIYVCICALHLLGIGYREIRVTYHKTLLLEQKGTRLPDEKAALNGHTLLFL